MNHQCPGNPLERYSSRREFFYVGLLGGLGLTLPQFLRNQAFGDTKTYETKTGVAKGIIHIFLPGGLAHQESFDPQALRACGIPGPVRSDRYQDSGCAVRRVDERHGADR